MRFTIVRTSSTTMEMMQLDTMMIELHSDANTLARVMRFEANRVNDKEPNDPILAKKLDVLAIMAKMVSKNSLHTTQVLMKVIEQFIGSKFTEG